MVVACSQFDEVPAVARAAGALPAAVDEAELADGGVGRLVDLVGRALQRIALDGARELLAEAGGAGVVGEQQHVAGRREQVIVPADEELVAPHAVRPAMDHDEQRILLRRVEPRRPHQETVDALAAAAR